MDTDLPQAIFGGLARNKSYLKVRLEKPFHDSIEDTLKELGVTCEREYRLTDEDRLDLWVPSLKTAIEVKLRPKVGALTTQLQRYLSHPKVDRVILVTINVPPGLPNTLAGKPVDIVPCWTLLLRM